MCWLVREAVLEVMDTRTSQCLASWKFGEIICDSNAYITCVKEYQYGSNRRLLVGVCYSSSSGLLCVLDLHLSKITKTIEIPQKVFNENNSLSQLLKHIILSVCNNCSELTPKSCVIICIYVSHLVILLHGKQSQVI